MLTSATRVVDIKPDNRVKLVTKADNGDLAVELQSGRKFTISKDDALFQEFVIYSILAEL